MNSLRLKRGVSAAGFLMFAASVAHAGIGAQGSADSVRIEAQNASLEEVLDVLRDSYGLTYISKVSLDQQVSGTYEGSLSRVVGLLLKDMNFVIMHRGETLHLTITSAAGRRETVGAMPSAATIPSPVAASSDAATKAAAKAASDIMKFVPPTPPPSPSIRDRNR